MNYEAERAMNQKRLRMEAEPGHGVVQGNGLPLNYIDNGHQIPYQPYAGAYNTHYPPPDAFAAYPPSGYAPQNLSYAPPAHQNYPHHQSFAQQPTQAQLHMAQSHMDLLRYRAPVDYKSESERTPNQPSPVQGYGEVVHKTAWPPQPHHLPPLDTQKPLDVKQLKPEIKLEPTDAQKRSHPEELMGGDLDQPKIKIKTDIFKPDDVAVRPEDKVHDASQVLDAHKPSDLQSKDEGQPNAGIEGKPGDKPAEAAKPEGAVESGEIRTVEVNATPEISHDDRKPFSSPELTKTSPGKAITPGSEPKKRGRPKGSTNKPKPPGSSPAKLSAPGAAAGGAPGAVRGPRPLPPPARPRLPGYQYAIRPFRKDFSGIQFRRRWSDECLDSSHIPNEVYFGDVPVSMEVLFNYYDANAEREKLAAQAAQIAAQKAAAAKLAAAKLQARGINISSEAAAKMRERGGLFSDVSKVTTVDSSSDDSDSDGTDSDDSDEDAPLKKTPGRPKGSKNAPRPAGTPGKRGRPPVPPELREPGIMDMKKFCKAAGLKFDYKKLVEGCTKNKERVAKMLDLLIAAGLEGKPTLEKCKAIKQAKLDAKEKQKLAKKEAKVKTEKNESEETTTSSRRMTRGATGVKPRQRIVISSDEEDDTPAARRTLSKLRSSVNDESDSD